jgi:hypothetical protein
MLLGSAPRELLSAAVSLCCVWMWECNPLLLPSLAGFSVPIPPMVEAEPKLRCRSSVPSSSGRTPTRTVFAAPVKDIFRFDLVGAVVCVRACVWGVSGWVVWL